jgi:hypothetical protein
LVRVLSCPLDKCPEDAPWLSTQTLKCYAEQAKSYYTYCAPSSPLLISESANETLSHLTTAMFLQLTSLQCNEGYEGRLCASCSTGYGVQVRSSWLPSRWSLVADLDVCRVTSVGLAPSPLGTGF